MDVSTSLRAPRAILQERDPARLAARAVEPIWNAVDLERDPEDVDRQLTALTPGQRALLAIAWCVAEVSNGGFEQFFSNPSGVLAREAREGFVRVGDEALASLIDHVAALFPSEWPARERRVRNFQLRQLRGPDADRIAAFGPYDDAFYACLGLEELDGECAAYVLEHPGEFVADADAPEQPER